MRDCKSLNETTVLPTWRITFIWYNTFNVYEQFQPYTNFLLFILLNNFNALYQRRAKSNEKHRNLIWKPLASHMKSTVFWVVKLSLCNTRDLTIVQQISKIGYTVDNLATTDDFSNSYMSICSMHCASSNIVFKGQKFKLNLYVPIN